MKNTKLYLGLFLSLMISMISCTKDDDVLEVIEDKTILQFDSEKSMRNEIDRIINFKNEKEVELIERIYGQIEVPLFLDKSNSKEIDKEELELSLRLYHKEKLKLIYSEREERNFTSIQSIADEINSLVMVNLSKAENLHSKYSNLIEKKGFLYQPIFDNDIALVTNTSGKIKVNDETVLFANNLAKGDSDIFDKHGIVATSKNNLLTITWAAGMRKNGNFVSAINDGDIAFAQLAAFVNINGQQILYPTTWYYTNPKSHAFFYDPLLFTDECKPIDISFPISAGAIVRNQEYMKLKCSNSFNAYNNGENNLSGHVSGKFIIAVPSGQFVIAENQEGVDF